MNRTFSAQIKELSRNKLQFLPNEISSCEKINYLDLGPVLTIQSESLRDSLSDHQLLCNTRLLCYKQLTTLTADNEITVFPPDLPECRLLCEMNPLVEEVPVGAIKEDQPLTLGEIAARMVMNWSRKNGTLEKLLKEFPALQSSGRCYICGNYFLSVWLECVKFTNVETVGLIRNAFK